MPSWVTPFWDRTAGVVVLVLDGHAMPDSVSALQIWGGPSEGASRLVAEIEPVGSEAAAIPQFMTPFCILPALNAGGAGTFDLRLDLQRRGRAGPSAQFRFDAQAGAARKGKASMAMILDPERLSALQDPGAVIAVSSLLIPGLEGTWSDEQVRQMDGARRNGGTVMLSPIAAMGDHPQTRQDGQGQRDPDVLIVGPMAEHVSRVVDLRARAECEDVENRGDTWSGEALRIRVDLGEDEHRARQTDQRLVFGLEHYNDVSDLQAGYRETRKTFGSRPVFLAHGDDGAPSRSVRTLKQTALKQAALNENQADGSQADGSGRWVAECAFYGLAHLDRAFVLHEGGEAIRAGDPARPGGEDSFDGDEVRTDPGPVSHAPAQAFVFMGRRALHDRESGGPIFAAFRRRLAGEDGWRTPVRSKAATVQGRTLDLNLKGQNPLTEAAYLILAGRLLAPGANQDRERMVVQVLSGLGIDIHKAGDIVQHSEMVFALLLPDLRTGVQLALEDGLAGPVDRSLSLPEIFGGVLDYAQEGGADWLAAQDRDGFRHSWAAFRAGADLTPFIRAGLPYDANLSTDELNRIADVAAFLRIEGLDEAVAAWRRGRQGAVDGRSEEVAGLEERLRRVERALDECRAAFEFVVADLPDDAALKDQVDRVMLSGLQHEDKGTQAATFIGLFRFASDWDGHIESAGAVAAFNALLPGDARALARVTKAGSWARLHPIVMAFLERTISQWDAAALEAADALTSLAGRFDGVGRLPSYKDGLDRLVLALMEEAEQAAAQMGDFDTDDQSSGRGDWLRAPLERLVKAVDALPDPVLDRDLGLNLSRFTVHAWENRMAIAAGLEAVQEDQAIREERLAAAQAIARILGLESAGPGGGGSHQGTEDWYAGLRERLEALCGMLTDGIETAAQRMAGCRALPARSAPEPVGQWADALEQSAASASRARDGAAQTLAILTDRRVEQGETPADPRLGSEDVQIVRGAMAAEAELRALMDRTGDVVDEFAPDSPYRDHLAAQLAEGDWDGFLDTLDAHDYLQGSLEPRLRDLGLDSLMVQDLAQLLLVQALAPGSTVPFDAVPDAACIRRVLEAHAPPHPDDLDQADRELDALLSVADLLGDGLAPVEMLESGRKNFRERLRTVRSQIISMAEADGDRAVAPSVGQVELVREGLKWWRGHFDAIVHGGAVASMNPLLVDALQREDLLPPVNWRR